jgi:hypothetical protein
MSPSSSGKQKSSMKQVVSSRVTFSRIHGVISQKIELCITTAVRTSNPAK